MEQTSAGGVDEVTFTLLDLPGLRDLTADRARRAGLRGEAVANLVIAVNEVATNAVLHGSDAALLRAWPDGGGLVVQIRDEGRWAGAVFGAERPPAEATSGMGLWVARLLADTVEFDTGAEGSTVTLRFTRTGAA
ncbi:ATP-binding protein [Nonomuraea longicatena]|uniref:Histidine kinase/HSP90-like ATPase domain-containing protein n=1 Tax=Nonomuraea longicatena TaxID=83682 RepID=A0ABN1QDS2_9ACTN